jgi:aspartate aminotransferase
MPQVSNKGKSMPESPIRKLVPYAEDAKKRGIKVYHLNIGQPDIKTPENVLSAVRNNRVEVLAYTRSEGSEEYRRKLTRYYAEHNISLSPEDIIITTGGSEALLFAFGSIMDAGDQIIIPEPFYANYNGFARANGVEIIPVTSRIEDGFALPPISEFEKRITEKTRAILICNPGNPTGYLYTKDELEQLRDLALRYDLFIISDEVYREFVYDGIQHYSIMSFPELKEHAILIDSVSKRYSMCGARIGYLISKNKQVIHTALKFAQARLSPPTYAQIAGEAALDTPGSYFQEVNREYKNRRDILIRELQKIPGVKVSIPRGAFYCMVELPLADAEDFARWLLEEFEYGGETVMVAPAAGFYATQGQGNNQVRIAYVLEEEALIRAVHILKEALSIYPDIR